MYTLYRMTWGSKRRTLAAAVQMWHKHGIAAAAHHLTVTAQEAVQVQ
jgi:hypothetical protein